MKPAIAKAALERSLTMQSVDGLRRRVEHDADLRRGHGCRGLAGERKPQQRIAPRSVHVLAREQRGDHGLEFIQPALHGSVGESRAAAHSLIPLR